MILVLRNSVFQSGQTETVLRRGRRVVLGAGRQAGRATGDVDLGGRDQHASS